MAQPIDYLAAAVVLEMRKANGVHVDTIYKIASVIEDYDATIGEEEANAIASRLQALGFARVVKDDYAGTYLEPASSGVIPFKLEKFRKAGDEQGFMYAISGGASLLEKAFTNARFWDDLKIYLKDVAEEPVDVKDEPIQAPASDRIVTISHNSPEGIAISIAIEAVVHDLQTNNAVADEAGSERERLLAEGAASLKLLAGERVRKSAFLELIWKFLREVAGKFKDKAAEWSVDRALDVMNKMLELMN